MLGLVGVLVVLLPVLAMLQWQWVGTLSDNEEDRMRRVLGLSVMRFSDELTHSFEEAHEGFMIEAASSSDGLVAILARRFQQWHATTEHPDLVEAIYVVSYEEGSEPSLHRFAPDATMLRVQSWSTIPEVWHTYFSELYAQQATDQQQLVLPSLPASSPGLVVPILVPFKHRGGASTDLGPVPSVNFVFLRLNKAYLLETYLPKLVQTYLFNEDHALYDVLIHHGEDAAEVLYRSAPHLTVAHFDHPDIATHLGFASQVAITTFLSSEGGQIQTTVIRHDSLIGGMSLDVERETRETVLVGKEHAEETVLYSQERSRVPGEARGYKMVKAGGANLPWRILIQHRAGSLEDAVESTRQRNLGISFGILLVLAVATVLLYVSAQRARRLADQQMAFVAGVTHELRTPLAVIRSAAENLADGIISNPQRAQQYGSLIRNEGRRLSEIIEQVLALAGAQSGKQTYTMQPVDVHDLLQKALERCQPALDEATFESTMHVASDLTTVVGDERALEAAVCNLITNAIKYAGPQGKVDVEARGIQNGASAELQITVRDKGPGIPASELPNVFEPFYRGETARQEQIRGSGLGLSLVQNTAQAHGGRVTVESEVGKGSAFTIHLPLNKT